MSFAMSKGVSLEQMLQLMSKAAPVVEAVSDLVEGEAPDEVEVVIEPKPKRRIGKLSQ